MQQKITMADLLDTGPENLSIQDALGKCLQQVSAHENILCSVSGGSDSDIMMDLLLRCGGKEKTTFVFFDTGLEYKATKRQIQFLQEKHGVEIKKIPPVKPIPICVKQHGVPFWSKHVSEMIERLQRHRFQWEDEPLDVLMAKYPGCRSALRWWCNDHGEPGKKSRFNIEYVPWLKEFMIANPPTFPVSAKCCTYAKKKPAHNYVAAASCDLNCTGVRKLEGGVRAGRYKTCYSQALAGPDQYRPLFWFSNTDKQEYDEHYQITHSDCYKIWGMTRTGCACCPLGQKFEQELELAQKYEPSFYRAAIKIFGQSYEYKRSFLRFRADKKYQEVEGLEDDEEQASFEI